MFLNPAHNAEDPQLERPESAIIFLFGLRKSEHIALSKTPRCYVQSTWKRKLDLN